MSSLPASPVKQRSADPAKGLWEDPCITLERDLEARAQGGPPNPENQFAPRGVLGPLSAPDQNCS